MATTITFRCSKCGECTVNFTWEGLRRHGELLPCKHITVKPSEIKGEFIIEVQTK